MYDKYTPVRDVFLSSFFITISYFCRMQNICNGYLHPHVCVVQYLYNIGLGWGMSYLKDYMSGRNILSFDGDYIKEYSTGRIKYRMSSDRVVDYMSGRTIYTFDNSNIKDYMSGRILLSVSGGQVRSYTTGRILASVDDSYVKDYMSGRILYKIDGFLSGREKMALIAILFG